MNIVLLGVGIGILSLLAPGPVNLSLVQVGARLGRQPAMQGAAGVMGGDSVLAVVAVGIVGVGAALPTQVFTTAQVIAAVLLALIGFVLVAQPTAVNASLERLQRPRRAFFLLTSCTPTALGGWIAMLAAMPFADDVGQLALFTMGVLIASYIWHPVLGLAASRIGNRLTDRAQQQLSRLGGASMVALGGSLMVRQVLFS